MLTKLEEAALRKRAEEQGIDPEEYLAAARAVDAEASAGDKGGAAPKGAPGAAEPPKLFQYHLPFITVKELREKWLGLTEKIDDEDLPCGEWLAKHGGALAGSPAAPPDTSKQE